MAYKVVVDAGHGGADPGAVFEGRKEKDDTLRLALAVGELLEQNGVDVVYTRTEDVYDTPYEKAMIANNSGADYFLSIHRNAVPVPNTASGVESLVYKDGGIAGDIGRSINSELQEVGFINRGVIERPNLVVLKRTNMPAVLVEAGFIDNEADNKLFDEEFDNIAAAIANGLIDAINNSAQSIDDDLIYIGDADETGTADMISEESDNEINFDAGQDDSYQSENRSVEERWPDYRMNEGRSNRFGVVIRPVVPLNPNPPVQDTPSMPIRPGGNETGQGMPGGSEQGRKIYRVQTGAFRVKQYADELVGKLRNDGFAPFIVYNDGLYRVQVGAFNQLDNAVKLEQRLRRLGYSTFITS